MTGPNFESVSVLPARSIGPLIRNGEGSTICTDRDTLTSCSSRNVTKVRTPQHSHWRVPEHSWRV